MNQYYVTGLTGRISVVYAQTYAEAVEAFNCENDLAIRITEVEQNVARQAAGVAKEERLDAEKLYAPGQETYVYVYVTGLVMNMTDMGYRFRESEKCGVDYEVFDTIQAAYDYRRRHLAGEIQRAETAIVIDEPPVDPDDTQEAPAAGVSPAVIID